MPERKFNGLHYILIAIVLVVFVATFSTISFFEYSDIEERRIGDVQKIRVYDQHNITLFFGKPDQGIEQIHFRLIEQKFFVDVKSDSPMWAEARKCVESSYGCLDVHIHSLNEIENACAVERSE